MEMGSPSGSLINCLICNNSFDLKPNLFVTSEESDEENQGTKGIQSAFILFCKLLLSKTNEGSDVCIQLLGEMFENLWRPPGGGRQGGRQFENSWNKTPFCGQCYQGIVEVRKLETIINETRMLQKCILDDLKKTLVSSQSSSSEGGLPSTSSGNRVRVAIRKQLVLNLGSEEIPSEASNHQETFPQSTRMGTKEGQNKGQSEESDNVKHRRLSPRKNLKRRMKLEEARDQQSPPPPPSELLSCLLTSDGLDLDDTGKVYSPRETEVVKEIYEGSNSPSNSSNDSDWHMEDRITSSDSEEEEISVPTRMKGGQARSTVSTRKQAKSSSSHVKVKDSDQPRTKKPDPPKPTAGGSRQTKLGSNEDGNAALNEISVAKKRQPFRNFFRIIPNKNLLLLLNSLIKYDYMQRLECLEEECGHVVQGTSTLSFENMREHVSVRHPNHGKRGKRTSRKCPFCGDHVHWLKPHLDEKHPDLPGLKVLCEICWKPLKSTTEMTQRHHWLHKSEEEQAVTTGQYATRVKSYPVECKECRRRFKTSKNLLMHEKSHQPKSVKRKLRIPKPKRPKQSVKHKPVQCKLCPSILHSYNAFHCHMYSQHKQGRELSCPICDKKFHCYRKTHFEEHVRSHTNEKPFVCEICGKAFAREVYLKTHSTVHTSSEKQFQCQFCGTKFKHKRAMEQHCRLRHPGMMKAPEKFTRKEDKLDFIGPKQMFPCDFCEKVFQWRCRMKKHVRLSHSQDFANLDSA